MVATVASQGTAAGELRAVNLVCEVPADAAPDQVGAQGIPLADGAGGLDVAVSEDGGDAYVLYDRDGARELAWVDLQAGETVDLNGGEFGRPKVPIDGGEQVAVVRGGRVLVAAGGAGIVHEFVADGSGDVGDGWFTAHDLPQEAGAVHAVVDTAAEAVAIVGAGDNLGRVILGEPLRNRVVTPGVDGEEGAFVAVATDPHDSDRSYGVLRILDGTWQARLLAFDVTAESTARPWGQGVVLQDDPDSANVSQQWRLAVSSNGELVFAAAVGGDQVRAFHRTAVALAPIDLPAALTDLAAFGLMPAELCDDIDQDCDGQTDEEIPELTTSTILFWLDHRSVKASHSVSLWDGPGWSVVFRLSDGRADNAGGADPPESGIWRRRFDAYGRAVGGDVRLLEFGEPFDVVQVGDDLLIVYETGRRERSSIRVAPDGRRLVGPTLLPSEGTWLQEENAAVRLERVPGGVALARGESDPSNRYRAVVVLLDEDGTPTTGPIHLDPGVAEGSSLQAPAMSWNDHHLGAAWASREAGIQFARVELDPFQLDGRVRLSEPHVGNDRVDLTWDGARWIAVYIAAGGCWFHPIDADGQPGPRVAIGVGQACEEPVVVAGGGQIIWARYRQHEDRGVAGLWMGRLNAAGVAVGQDLQVLNADYGNTLLHRLAQEGRYFSLGYSTDTGRANPMVGVAITAMGCSDPP